MTLCFVCDLPITDDDWSWAAIPENGKVHNSCFMSDDELRADQDWDEPCTGCTALCEYCQTLEAVDYCDGVNRALIFRDGRVFR